MDAQLIHKEIEAALVLGQLGLASRAEAAELCFKGVALSEIFKIWKNQERPEVKAVLEKFNPEKEIMACAAKKIEMISISDSAYPEILRSIVDPPFVLFARGQVGMLQDLSIAVVGSRHASFYGMEQARRFSRVLADSGLTIVSGLALGIDQAAHESALDACGHTVAVLGCGMDVIYPKENRKLFERIAVEGLILSEYPLGSEPLAYHFPRRNRILSGLSLGVLVVEAHERSGSLITAYQALEQGREVFSIPGPVHHITSRGTHRLIREGATLVEAPEEIIASIAEHPGLLQMQIEKRERPLKPEPLNVFSYEETAAFEMPVKKNQQNTDDPILKILQEQNRDYEGLFELSAMEPHIFAQVLTELEIEGKVRKNSSGYYELS